MEEGLEAEYEKFLPYDEQRSKSFRKSSYDRIKEKSLISDEHELISLTLQNMQIPVEYLCVSNGKIYQSFLKLDPTQKKISFFNTANGLAYLQIDLKDFISFVNESYIPEDTKKKLTADFQLNNSTLEEKQFCRITYVPNRSKSKCNFCNLIFCGDCNCTKTVTEKNFYVSFFLITKAKIAEIENELNKINLGLLPRIKELRAKNRKRKILFFVNPKSGTGISLKIWAKAKSIFDLTDIDKTVIFTNKYKHAYEVVKKLKVGEYDGIVNCSGDGVLHEIVNAICHREDRDIFLNRVTVGALPAGSANGYPKAISDYCGDDNRLETHCYYICKGATKQIDLQEMELRDVKEKVYSFLSIYYGFIADADLESEG